MRGRRLTADAKAGLLLLGLALAYLAMTLRIPTSSFASADVGPKGFPLAIGIALAAASVALVVRGLRGPSGDGAAAPEMEVILAEEAVPTPDARKLGVVVGLLLGYILVFTALGYLLATFLFIAATTTFLDRRHPVRNLLFGLVFPAVVYVVFTRLLGVVLPVGPLG